MARKTKALSGEGARRYFRALFAAELPRDPGSADRLAATCVREIAELRVRMPLVARRLSGATAAEPKPDPSPAESVTQTVAGPAPVALDTPVAADPVSTADAPPADSVAAATSAAEPFDPHAFSLVVAYRREGRDGLMARLAAIGDATRLRQIARAQHVSLGSAGDEATIDSLCREIVAGTERRIAHREAAAS